MVVVSSSILGLFLGASLFPSVAGVDGRMHSPLAEAGGKPLAMIFISHDCPVCNTYAPELRRIEATYGRKVQIELVYADSRLSNAEAKQHAKEFSIDHATLLIDPRHTLAAFCLATYTPEAIVFDSRGKQVYAGRIDDRYYSLGRQRPAPTTHDLTQALIAVLAHKTPKPASGPPVGCIITLPRRI